MKKLLIIILVISIAANVFLVIQLQSDVKNVNFNDANSRETYFSVHNVLAAQQVSKGKGIKVGILDHYFGCEEHNDEYSGSSDFLNNTQSLNKISEHGYWMANVLKEIAPDCEVYALNTMDNSNEDKKVDAMVRAIDWAITNHIDILTYSGPQISQKNRKKLDDAVNKAVANHIVTTFINYDNENNIWPFGMYPYPQGGFSREPDVNIYQYDYNILRIDTYKKFEGLKSAPQNGDEIPYFSLSSTSPVTAGFVAILKSINNTLSPSQYKEILIKTSYRRTYKGQATFENGECPRTVDIMKAVNYLKENY